MSGQGGAVVATYSSWAEVAGELEGRLLELVRAYRRAGQMAAEERRGRHEVPRDMAAERAMVHRWTQEYQQAGHDLATLLLKLTYERPTQPGGNPATLPPRDLP